MNFVSNAVKYTKAGTVTLVAEAKEADHPGYRMMRITVKIREWESAKKD